MASKASQSRNSEVQDGPANGSVETVGAPFRRMLRDMAALATASAEDETFRGDTLARIYTAETDDDIWDADMVPPLNGKILAGCELQLVDLEVKYSRGDSDMISPWVYIDDKGREKKMYLLITSRRISKAGEKRLFNLPAVGEDFQWNTSAQFLAAKIFTFYARGRFGNGQTMTAMIQETDLGGDKSVLKLVRPIDRSQGTAQAHAEYQGELADSEPPF